MSSSRAPFRIAGFGFFSLIGAFSALQATVIEPVSDGDLLSQATLVVVARHEHSWPALGDRPETDHQFTVERLVKGYVPDTHLLVRALGGPDAGGRWLLIHGSPRFEPGDRALLFLARDAEGNWRILHVVQGVFLERQRGNQRIAERPLQGVLVLPRITALEETESRNRVRDFERFVSWLERKARGEFPGPSYWIEVDSAFSQPEDAVSSEATQPDPLNSSFPLAPSVDSYSFFNSGGLKLRWFNFDTGGTVSWYAHESGQPNFPGGGFVEFERALAAWNDEPETPIQLVYAGTTTATAGFQRFDGINAILFNDPNQDIQGTFDCSSGGTLAIGGPWSNSSNTGVFNGETFVRIQGADIVFNDGIDCRFPRSRNASKFVEEVMGHELGHTLGLGHSSEVEGETNPVLRDALMFFRAHDDGRGASLREDDLGGIRYLYRPSGGSSGGGGGGSGGGSGSCPSGSLCLLNGRFRVSVTWQNQFNNTSGVGGAIPYTDLSGFLYFTDPNNIELIVKILDFQTVFKVFYSQMTNLRFTLTVTDTFTGRTKTYSNTAGECGAIDETTFPKAVVAPLETDEETDTFPITQAATAGNCVSDEDTLCLLSNRFALEVTWRNQFNGQTGVGVPRALSPLTGAFSFGDPANLELLVKTLDFGTKILVIYGALSNFEYTLRVTDTVTGRVKTYQNPAGRFCGGIDDNAFPPA